MSDQDASPTEPVTEPVVEPTQPVTAPSPTSDSTISNPASSPNPFEDLLGKIKREDGTLKYNTVEDALTSVPASQAHIQTLENELQELRAKDIKETSMADILEALKKDNPPTSEQVPATSSPEQTEELVAQLVHSEIERRGAEDAAFSNANTVVERLVKEFGSQEAAENAYLKAAQTLGINKSFLDDTARQSPNALFQLMGLENTRPSSDPIHIPTQVLADSLGTNTPEDIEVPSAMGVNSKVSPLDSWNAAGKKVAKNLGL